MTDYPRTVNMSNKVQKTEKNVLLFKAEKKMAYSLSWGGEEEYLQVVA